ncbi:hypothetical protein GUITHDRAFT_102195 [Guillardia theta CCMP2712]|uniref:Uncharacterized protein n=1 Tax=Guillardia theta (strain CCMP2712) TaxID=905079 RepID=L1JVA2_GUITC|nr:hypothetical protein GUITHDRAFT_102195 [Guillardia theta CCMP2712]EKX52292.1 hypothetical protein GUITHDRAFT_102195 [Guillardia theta CCMP2712]|eukprot:XP_005839272.1 hypothetical protein GUITHDRAFT_102195 [Guillardia theta CCMP2712]
MKPKAERVHVQAVLEKAALEKQLRMLKKVAVSYEEKKPEQAQNVNMNLALVGAGLAKMKNMRDSSSNDSESDAWSSD